MKNQSKHNYVPCEVNVTEFNVERGFAQSNGLNAAINGANNAINGWETTGASASRNEAYGFLDMTQKWADEHSSL